MLKFIAVYPFKKPFVINKQPLVEKSPIPYLFAPPKALIFNL